MNNSQLSESYIFEQIKKANKYKLVYYFLPLIYFICYLIPMFLVTGVNDGMYNSSDAMGWYFIFYFTFLVFMFPATICSVIIVFVIIFKLNKISTLYQRFLMNKEYNKVESFGLSNLIENQIKTIKVLRVVHIIIYVFVLFFILFTMGYLAITFSIPIVLIIIVNIVLNIIVRVNTLNLDAYLNFSMYK